MKPFNLKFRVRRAIFFSALCVQSAHAVEPSTGIVGKNEWLFYRYETTDASDAAKTNATLDLIQRFNKVLADNDIAMAVAMVPLKMRIYAEHLPDDVKVNDYMSTNSDRMVKVLRNAGVHVLDINTAFLNSPKRTSDSPLFFRLDQNWSPNGVMVAAEAIKEGIMATPTLKSALEATPEDAFKVVWSNRKRASKGRDLIQHLPPDSQTFAPEQVSQVTIHRMQPPKLDALGKRASIGITLLGSGYSHDWTGFSDALRFTLQRDIFSIGVGTDQGSWVGMENYLQSDFFQAKAPGILIWEMPERDMRAPPDYKFRDTRYQSDNSEWLLRVSALVQTVCKPSTVSARLVPTGIAKNSANVKDGKIEAGPVGDGDFIEISFDKPIEKLDYLRAQVATHGSKAMVFEGSGPGVVTRRFSLNIPGDGAPHVLKMPFPSNGVGYTKIRISPGQTNTFSLQDIQVCHLPKDPLL